ncbi:MAG: DUF1330 domain-containing protein [Myxococcales bacterium]|nr:DUF1330 domain-containing protein [Myxococcales bacterium]
MSCYVLARTSVHDPAAFERYRSLAGPSIQAHEGHVVAKGKVLQSLEGEEAAEQMALIAFPSTHAARTWFESPAYQQAIQARRGVATMTLTLLE